MDELKDRLVSFVRYLGLNNAEFEREVGLSNGFVSKASYKTRKTSIKRVCDKYPQLNPDWLLNGKGEMIRENVNTTQNVDRLLKIIEHLMEQLQEEKELNKRLQMEIIRRLDENNNNSKYHDL